MKGRGNGDGEADRLRAKTTPGDDRRRLCNTLADVQGVLVVDVGGLDNVGSDDEDGDGCEQMMGKRRKRWTSVRSLSFR